MNGLMDGPTYGWWLKSILLPSVFGTIKSPTQVISQYQIFDAIATAKYLHLKISDPQGGKPGQQEEVSIPESKYCEIIWNKKLKNSVTSKWVEHNLTVSIIFEKANKSLYPTLSFWVNGYIYNKSYI